MSDPRSVMRHLDFCHNGSTDDYRTIFCDGVPIGWVDADRAEFLKDNFSMIKEGAVGLVFDFPVSIDKRTEILAAICWDLHQKGLIKRWRDERLAIAPDVPLTKEGPFPKAHFLLEREAAGFFGLRSFGVHMNGFVRKPEGLYLWVGKRSDQKPNYPGELDHIVAGGQPAGLSLRDNLEKEAQEEASLPASLVKDARFIGPFSYIHAIDGGLRPDKLFIFDLELPADFEPHNEDGEVQSFSLMAVEDVWQLLVDTDDFKYNCAAIILDFLIRHKAVPNEMHSELDQAMEAFRTRP